MEYQIGKLKLPIFWSMFMLCILMWPISSSLKPKDASQNLHSKPWSSSFPMWIWDFCWQSSFFAKWFFLISLLSKHLGQYLHLKSFSPAIKKINYLHKNSSFCQWRSVDPYPFYCIKRVWIDQNKNGYVSTKTSLTVHAV